MRAGLARGRRLLRTQRRENAAGGWPLSASKQAQYDPRSLTRLSIGCDKPVELKFHIEPNLRHLRAYLAVSDSGSVQRAAEKLHLTQSSLSRPVQQLERQLGLKLFERTRRGMILTEFGAILSQRVRRAVGHLDTVEKELIAEHAKAGTARYPS